MKHTPQDDIDRLEKRRDFTEIVGSVALNICMAIVIAVVIWAIIGGNK